MGSAAGLPRSWSAPSRRNRRPTASSPATPGARTTPWSWWRVIWEAPVEREDPRRACGAVPAGPGGLPGRCRGSRAGARVRARTPGRRRRARRPRDGSAAPRGAPGLRVAARRAGGSREGGGGGASVLLGEPLAVRDDASYVARSEHRAETPQRAARGGGQAHRPHAARRGGAASRIGAYRAGCAGPRSAAVRAKPARGGPGRARPDGGRAPDPVARASPDHARRPWTRARAPVPGRGGGEADRAVGRGEGLDARSPAAGGGDGTLPDRAGG